MWIRLFSCVSVVCLVLYSNIGVTQIPIHSQSDTRLGHQKIKSSAIDFLTIPEHNIIEFHDRSLSSMTSDFLYNDNTVWTFQLDRTELTSSDLNIEIFLDQFRSIDKKGLHISSFTGRLIGNKKSEVFLNIIDKRLDLIVKDGGKKYHISWSAEQNSYKYEVFNLHLKNNTNLRCSEHSNSSTEIKEEHSHLLKSNTNTCLEINLQFYTDYLFYEEYDQDIEYGLLKIISTVSQIQQDYEPFNINFNLNAVQFSSCELCDPWTTSRNASTLLADFDLKTDPINDNSIKLLLTGRSLNDLFVGMARFNSFCTESSKAIIQDISSTTWQQRVIVSHEIGHILGSNHDNSTNNIMSSSLNNTSEWTSNSFSIIQNKISNSSCLEICADNVCPQIIDIQITDKSSDELKINWTSNTSTSVYYELSHINTAELKASGYSDSQIVVADLLGCEEYKLKLNVECGDGRTNTYSKTITTRSDEYIEISQIDVMNCDPNSFDLKLSISHNLENQQEISVTIGNETHPFLISPTTSFILINSLNNHGHKDELITVNITNLNSNLCSSKITYDMPEIDCSLKWIENFNQATIPNFWSLANSNSEYFVSPYSWKIDGSNREIANYDYSYHETNGNTINGSNMMYMDDDFLAFNSYTGTTTLLSPKWDLMAYTDITISFDYIFHKFIDKGDNQSNFKIEVWTGSEWVAIFTAEETNCYWFKIWETHCSYSTHIDLSFYKNSAFQLRFIYSDGNDSKWTGMAAFDDFVLEASNPVIGCLDLDALNYNNQADVHNQQQCMYECAKDFLSISAYPEAFAISEINRIEASGTISQSTVNLTAQTTLELVEGFSIEKGSTLVLDTQQCSN